MSPAHRPSTGIHFVTNTTICSGQKVAADRHQVRADSDEKEPFVGPYFHSWLVNPSCSADRDESAFAYKFHKLAVATSTSHPIPSIWPCGAELTVGTSAGGRRVTLCAEPKSREMGFSGACVAN